MIYFANDIDLLSNQGYLVDNTLKWDKIFLGGRPPDPHYDNKDFDKRNIKTAVRMNVSMRFKRFVENIIKLWNKVQVDPREKKVL